MMRTGNNKTCRTSSQGASNPLPIFWTPESKNPNGAPRVDWSNPHGKRKISNTAVPILSNPVPVELIARKICGLQVCANCAACGKAVIKVEGSIARSCNGANKLIPVKSNNTVNGGRLVISYLPKCNILHPQNTVLICADYYIKRSYIVCEARYSARVFLRVNLKIPPEYHFFGAK